jgi:hypothetical protein
MTEHIRSRADPLLVMRSPSPALGEAAIGTILGLKRELKACRGHRRLLESELARERAAKEKAVTDLQAFQNVFATLHAKVT